MEIQSDSPDRNSMGEAYREMVAKKSEESTTPGGEVEQKIEWGKIDNIADARAELEAAYGAVLSSSKVFGDGAEFIKDKNILVNKPFLILDWRVNVDPDTGNKYVNVLIMGPNGDKARFNDGGVGVCKQLMQVQEQYGIIGIECKYGLRKSEYTVPQGDGKPPTKAVTFYLA